MPCNKEHRKIVSKSQQRALFAKANRGEISKKKVIAMAEKTKKSKGSLKNLPEKTASVHSVVNSVYKAAASNSEKFGKLFGWIKQLGVNKKASVNKEALRITKISPIANRLAGRSTELDWYMKNVRNPINREKRKVLVNKVVKQVAPVKKNGESMPQASWPLDSAPVKPYTSENYKFSSVRNVTNRIGKIAIKINPGNDAMQTMMNKSMSPIKDSMKPMNPPKPTTTVMNKPNKSPFDKSSSVNKPFDIIRNFGVNKTALDWNTAKSNVKRNTGRVADTVKQYGKEVGHQTGKVTSTVGRAGGKVIDKVTDFVGGAKGRPEELPKVKSPSTKTLEPGINAIKKNKSRLNDILNIDKDSSVKKYSGVFDKIRNWGGTTTPTTPSPTPKTPNLPPKGLRSGNSNQNAQLAQLDN